VVDVAAAADGEISHLFLDGVPVLLCRWRGALYAYRDLCPVCTSDFTAGVGVGQLRRGLADGAPLATCPGCGRHFDVHRAGAGVESDAHLEPFPLLERDGHLEIVLPADLLADLPSVSA
jgi:nitrite reductase/ring-hydroxylating ferredoxin subunit